MMVIDILGKKQERIGNKLPRNEMKKKTISEKVPKSNRIIAKTEIK